MTPIRVAIIGFGLGGEVFHAPLIAATPGMSVAGIVTTAPERQRKATEQYPQAAILQSAEALWAQPDQFDLVVVTTPNRWHAPFGLAALRAGLPVVIDKPLALNMQEARELLAASRAAQKPAIPFHNRRWDGDFLTLRKLIQGDWLGEIVRFESHFDRFNPTPKVAWREENDPAVGGGLLYDLGSHLIDQAIQLFGMSQMVYAELPSRRRGAQVDDDSFVALECPNGVIAHLYFSQIARIAGPRFVVRGMRGTYIKNGLDSQEAALRQGMRPGMPHWGEEPRERWGIILAERDDLTFEGIIPTLPGAYEQFYRQVAETLTTGAPPPVTIEQALLTQRVIEAVQHSAQQRTAIQIAPEA
jgi:scyllo-inositol 2-dehydrogenase (NADP+)